jgi:hypothetical protein
MVASIRRGLIQLAILLALISSTATVNVQPVSAQPTEPPVLLGIYPSGNLQTKVSQIQAIDTWSGKHHSIAATFVDLEFPNPDYNVPADLDAAWNAGYTPYVNLLVGYNSSPTRTASYVASGAIDTAIHAWAHAFALWADGGNKQAFLAPFPEMNGDWIPYGLDPDGYKQALARIQSIFAAEGVPDSSVSWVFAPNGWSDPGDPGFEAYFPGQRNVDVVGISAYNTGTDPTCNSWPVWEGPSEVFTPYLDRLRAMAPMLPIFIAQTASASSGGDKSQWLIDSYAYLASYPGVRAILYYNQDLPSCNWDYAVYLDGSDGSRQVAGYPTAIAPSDFSYQFPIPLAFDPQPSYTFDDVWRASPFAGVPNHPDWPYVQTLYDNGYVAGCSTDPPLYCPYDTMNRAQASVFVERGAHSATYTPATPGSPPFDDVPLGMWFTNWVDGLKTDGYTAGCSLDPPLYCPTRGNTRAEGAVFFERMLHGPTYSPPDPTIQVYGDVPLGSWYAPWVTAAYDDGLLEPCDDGVSPPLYCPMDPLTRGQAARMMVRAKGLALP